MLLRIREKNIVLELNRKMLTETEKSALDIILFEEARKKAHEKLIKFAENGNKRGAS